MKTETGKKDAETPIGGMVCVIDGDLGIQDSLKRLFSTLGVRAAAFSTAEEFLDRLNGEEPAFLITELALPGMSGFDLLKVMDGKGVHVPVIGLTGDLNPQDRKEAARLGILELVEKPFVYWPVVDWVQQTLGAPSLITSF